MTDQPTPAELQLADRVTALAALLWERSRSIEGPVHDSQVLSAVLYKRLWGHHRAFLHLWNADLLLEADVILRSGLEAAICIAANFKLGEQFAHLIKQDAVATIVGQSKQARDRGELELHREAEAVRRDLVKRFDLTEKAEPLKWKELAIAGQVPDLYGWHKMLSGVAAHVTGLSILPGVIELGGGSPGGDELERLRRKMHLMMMTIATLKSTLIHAGIINADDLVKAGRNLTDILSSLSEDWLGAVDTLPV